VSGVRRLILCVKILARDPRIPKPLRAAVAVGLLPLPGPLDEAILLLVAIPLIVFYRQSMREAWQQAGARTVAGEAVRRQEGDPQGGPPGR
jgi:hypothetical protein